MRALRGMVVVAAVAAVLLAAFSRDGAEETTKPAAGPANAIRLQFAYSSNLEEMMDALLRRFNAERVEVDGRPVFVVGVPASSGDVHSKIVAGEMKPHIWTPASSLWGRLLNYEADEAYVRDDNPSLASSPIVIAMWEPLARALGWPAKGIGFADVLRLATSRSDWAAFGKPTFGRFKLGHTNPDFSTSGLAFVAAQYYNAAGKREGLRVEDVEDPRNRAKVRAIERSIVHYGDTGSFFAEQLAEHGPAFASAVAMEETTLIEFNAERRSGEMRLVAVYPEEGTFVADNPYMVLNAPWVNGVQRRAAAALGAWLEEELTPAVVARFHYRPGDPRIRPLAPVTTANGVDPAKPERVLSLPEPRVLAAIKAAWREDRKPANILLVVDVSGSMQDDGKLAEARLGLSGFLDELAPHDRVGLLTFSDLQTMLAQIEPFSRNKTRLKTLVSELVAGGDTALYDATLRGWSAVDNLRDEDRINAVVVLSDGEDTASDAALDSVVARLRTRAESEGRSIRVFTIAYGRDARLDVLERIARASGGKAYSGDPETIRSVYVQISSYF